jgi:hypothetical protein
VLLIALGIDFGVDSKYAVRGEINFAVDFEMRGLVLFGADVVVSMCICCTSPFK